MIQEIIADLRVAYGHKPHRLDHVYGVRDTALALGKQYHCNLEWLELASLLHDITKYESTEFHKEMIRKTYSNPEEIINEYNDNILHAFSAASVAETKYGITTPEILDAIRHHTVGRPQMSIYEEILFISDYIEPHRTYDSCVRAREYVKESLTKAIYFAIKDSIEYHEQQQVKVPKTAYKAVIYYQRKLEEQT